MTTAYEETWTAHKDCVVEARTWKTIFIPHEDTRDGEGVRARAQLAAQAPTMARLLAEVLDCRKVDPEVEYALGTEMLARIEAVLSAAGVLP